MQVKNDYCSVRLICVLMYQSFNGMLGIYDCFMISTESPTDYNIVSTQLMFNTCDSRQCSMITIVNDTIRETEEIFNVSIERTPGLDGRIILDPVEAEIETIDRVGTCMMDIHTGPQYFVRELLWR